MGELAAGAVGVFLGALVLVVGVGVANRLDARQRRRKQGVRQARLADYDSDGRLASAYAASDLAPWVSEMGDLRGCRIQVLGGDGTYINQENGRVWRGGLEAWINKGLDVDYILLGIDERTREQYMRLLDDLNGKDNARLRVLVAQRPAEGYPEGVRETEEDLRTCHPTLLYGTDHGEWAMWIEGDHQPNSAFAYDVWYVPPNAMKDEQRAEFRHYEDQIEAIKPYCVDLADAVV